MRIFNLTYLRSQDAMVAYYPDFSEFSDERNDFRRHELYTFL